VQDEDFNEYEGIYDELNLEEEEAKFGLANEEDEDDSDESDVGSDGMYSIATLIRKLI
jgi:CCR4-NOT transcription complex subunit 3